MDIIAIMILACGGLLVRVGYACYAAGLSRSKNATGAVLRQTVDLCAAALAFWAVGAAFYYYDGGAFLGIQVGRLIDWNGDANGVTPQLSS